MTSVPCVGDDVTTTAVVDDEDDDDVCARVPFLAPHSALRPRTSLFYQRHDSNTHVSRGKATSHDDCAATHVDAAHTSTTPALTSTTPAAAAAATAAATTAIEDGEDDVLLQQLEQLYSADTLQRVRDTAASTLPICAHLLTTYLGITSGRFRPRQEEACLCALQQHSTLVVCPTGWGKTLCYQFPMLVHRLRYRALRRRWHAATTLSSSSCLLRDARPRSMFCVVVSPLLALMSDQMTRMQRQRPPAPQRQQQKQQQHAASHDHDDEGDDDDNDAAVVAATTATSSVHGGVLSAVALTANTSPSRAATLLRQLSDDDGDIDILFVSPERLVSDAALRQVLRTQRTRVAFVCIDEVHCVSRWAYDFRPAYLYIHCVVRDMLLQLSSSSSSDAVTAAASSSSSSSSPALPFLCLTATASHAVVCDVQRIFAVTQTVVYDAPRTHLRLESEDMTRRAHARAHARASCDGGGACTDDTQARATTATSTTSTTTTAMTAAVVPTQRDVHEALLEAVQQLPTPMLVYVQTRNDAEELAHYLTVSLAGNNTGSCSSSCDSESSSRRPQTTRNTHTAVVDGDATTAATTTRRRVVFAPSSLSRTRRVCAVARATRHKDENDNDEDGTRSCRRGGALVVRCYHAALSRHVRTRTQQQFVVGEVDVLVATVAFGMGIDKANVRSVVHAHAPSSLEAYVQEIGRAGRDGGVSVCRVLYNPYDYYMLRNRQLTALLSPAEMHAIVSRLLQLPTSHNKHTNNSSSDNAACTTATTQYGERVLLVSPTQLASVLDVAEEAVETVLFMLLTCSEPTARCGGCIDDDSGNTNINNNNNNSADGGGGEVDDVSWCSNVLTRVHGTCPLGFRVVAVRRESDSNNDNNNNDVAVVAAHHADHYSNSSRSSIPGSGRKRMRVGTRAARSSVTLLSSSLHAAGAVGVSDVLAQLHTHDSVLELCRRSCPRSAHDDNDNRSSGSSMHAAAAAAAQAPLVHLVDAANALRLPLAELRARLDELVASGMVTLRWTSSPCYIVAVGDGYARVARARDGVARVAAQLQRQHSSRLFAQIASLRMLFAVLQQPTHARLAAALRRGSAVDADKTTTTKEDKDDGATTRMTCAAVARMRSSKDNNNDNNKDDDDEEDVVARTAAWQPPPRTLRRVDAVALLNAFVEQNRLRLHSTYEAARALLGVLPRSNIKRGRYAGQLPLSQSWYVHSPYFGALREYDVA